MVEPLFFTLKRKGKEYQVLIDRADLGKVISKKWYVQMNERNKKPQKPHIQSGMYIGGGRKHQKSRTTILSRYLMNCPKGLEVDHINGNTLDNRRQNLRIVTPQQNCQNRHTIKGKSGIRGVRKARIGWQARVESKGKTIFSKNFSTKEEAHKAVVEARKRLFPFSTEVEI